MKRRDWSPPCASERRHRGFIGAVLYWRARWSDLTPEIRATVAREMLEIELREFQP